MTTCLRLYAFPVPVRRPELLPAGLSGKPTWSVIMAYSGREARASQIAITRGIQTSKKHRASANLQINAPYVACLLTHPKIHAPLFINPWWYPQCKPPRNREKIYCWTLRTWVLRYHWLLASRPKNLCSLVSRSRIASYQVKGQVYPRPAWKK
jgi:hypothetical protein